MLATFEEAGVPVKVVNNARSELETFADCCSFCRRGRGVHERLKSKKRAQAETTR